MVSRLIDLLGAKFANVVYRYLEQAHARALPRFSNQPKNLRIEFPSRIVNASHMTIGDDVSLGPGCMLNAIKHYPGKFMQGVSGDIQSQTFNPEISIGNRVSITGFATITAVNSVVIEDDVLIASHVFISDHSHGRERADIPYKYQQLSDFGDVVIGKGSWIGEHAVVMPGVTIGKNSIVGANSVVTCDVPDRTIVAGSPARVYRVWSREQNDWVRANPE